MSDQELTFASLLCGQEEDFLKKLKTQRYVLTLGTFAEGPCLLRFLYAAAMLQGFQEKVLKGWVAFVSSRMKGSDGLLDATLDSPVWQAFDQQYERARTQALATGKGASAPPLMGVDAARILFEKGFMSLCTHMDKAQENPQPDKRRDTLFSDLGPQFGQPEAEVRSYDAKVFVLREGGNLGPGVSLSMNDQRALGIVCSSDKPIVTSVGAALTAMLEQFFMLRWRFVGEESSRSLYELLAHGDRAGLGYLLGLQDAPTEEVIIGWLEQPVGEKAFMSALYVLTQQVIAGRLLHVQLMESPVQPLHNQVRGRGLKLFHIQDHQGHHSLVCPLINAGLMRDLQTQYERAGEMEFSTQWRRLFHSSAIGGSKPQNAGTFFTSFLKPGDGKMLRMPLAPQTSGLRLLAQRLRKGQHLYRLTQEQALAICARTPQKGSQWLRAPLNIRRARALERRVAAWVDSVLLFYRNVRHLMEQNRLHVPRAEKRSLDTVCAEFSVIQGVATEQEIEVLTRHLYLTLFRKTCMTDREKKLVSVRMKSIIMKRMAGM